MGTPGSSRSSNLNFNQPAHHSRRRVLVMIVVGMAVAVGTGVLNSWSYAPATGWAAACLTYLIWVWSVVGRLSPEATDAHASREDPGRRASDVLVLTATL